MDDKDATHGGPTHLSCKLHQDEGCQRPNEAGVLSTLNSIQMEY